jgi:hypothetical protein
MMDQVTTSERSASSLHTVTGHAEHVYLVGEGATPPPYIEDVSSSWQRSANKYSGDSVDTARAPRILAPGELKHHREPLDELIFSAQEEIDQLYKVVREAQILELLRRAGVRRRWKTDGSLGRICHRSRALGTSARADWRPLAVRSARAIEERFCSRAFPSKWIVAVGPPEGGVLGMLLAIDGNQRSKVNTKRANGRLGRKQ